ncbi:MAG: hypothetical protein II244_02120, partial [Clostridia bacterium]|nr:hypothetical protein [Clostridia bacterium]
MYDYRKFKPLPLKEIKIYKGKEKGTITYLDPAFYDSETSNDTDFDLGVEFVYDTWVYLWAMGIGNRIYYGRTIAQFAELLQNVIKAYELRNDRIMIIYVHNLPYDASYIWHILFELDPDLTCLALSPNKPFVIQMHNVGIEFRCSYRLANRSLDKWCKDLGVKQAKKTGMINYKERHTPTEKLQEEQFVYMNYDIVSLRECFKKECEVTGYNFSNIPLTSTGYVRRVFKKAYNKGFKKYINLFQRTKPNADQYKRLCEASAGGMSEVGRHVIGRTIHGRIRHRDFDSHYPTQMECMSFPMQPITIFDAENGINAKRPVLKSKIDWYLSHNYRLILDINIKELQIKKGVTAPFLMKSKLTPESKSTDILHVNGKVVKISGGCARVTITSDDYLIYREQYDFKMSVIACDAYNLEPLPDYVRDTVREFYLGKNELKITYKQTGLEEDRIDLMLQKNKLNGIFGCCYSHIVRDNIQPQQDYKWKIEHQDLQKGIDTYYNTRGNCLAFQWGVRVCSSARKELHAAIAYKIGYQNFLYCDTDSAFYKETEENKIALLKWNDELQEKSKQDGHFVTVHGQPKYFNYFDDEKEDIVSFRALHSKCYGFITSDGKMTITVAGVPRETNGIKREDELQSLDNLKDGFVFRDNGGTRAVYFCHPV